MSLFFMEPMFSDKYLIFLKHVTCDLTVLKLVLILSILRQNPPVHQPSSGY